MVNLIVVSIDICFQQSFNLIIHLGVVSIDVYFINH